MQEVTQNLYVCMPLQRSPHPLFRVSFDMFWALIEQLQPSLDPAHTVWTGSHWIRPSSLQKTSCTGLSTASRLMCWCWQIFHTHCRTIRFDAIRLAALKRCIWRSLQTEGSVCLMQRVWRTCFSSTKAADDKFSSSSFWFLSWLHTCLLSLSSPHPVLD